MKKVIFLFLLIKFLFAINVLVLNSYSVQFPWTRGEVEGILKKLKNKNLKIYIEFMDTKKFKPTPIYLKNFYIYLTTKYKAIPPDIVIVTDDNALNFVIKHKNDFFKKSKVFFAGINNLNIAKKINRNEYTGVFEKKEPLFNLSLAKKVVKDLKYVYVLSDDSTSGKSVIKEYKNAFKKIKDYDFIYINDSNLSRVLNLISNPMPNSVMLLLTPFSFNYKKMRINYKKAIKLISKVFPLPIIIHTDILASLKNTNIIGGRVTDALSQGEIVAQKVLDYLNGKKLNQIPLTFEKANKLYLNIKNLKKFGINAYDLGYKNAIYVNKQENVFQRYKYLISSVIVLFFLMAVFIMILYMKNKQLQKFSKANINVDNEVEKRFLSEIESNKSKINALIQYFNIILLIIKRNIYEGERNLLLKRIAYFQKFLFEKDIKNVKECVLDIIESYNPTTKEIYITGEKSFVKLDPLVLSEILFYIFENCDKITINFFENEIKIYIRECNINIETLNNFLKSFRKNITLQKEKKLIVSITN